MPAIISKLNIPLRGWYGYFKHVKLSELKDIDGWIRMRLRSILRKRDRKKGRGRGRDHQRWPNRYFNALGLHNLMETKLAEFASLRQGATH
jgi:RNA-directed DNA polymerase